MEGALSALLEAGPAYLLAAILLAILVAFWRAAEKRDAARNKRLDELADRLYEVAMAGVKKDEQVHATLEAVRREVEEVRKTTSRGSP